MRGDKAEKLARRYDLGLFPELRKMPQVSSHQVVVGSSVSALNKYVVIRVRRYIKPPAGVTE